MKRPPHDQDLLQIIGQCTKNADRTKGHLKIFDSRPKRNAQANQLKGGGYEDCGPGQTYQNCSLKFCNIENIHEVTKSYEKMCQLAYQPTESKSLFVQ